MKSVLTSLFVLVLTLGLAVHDAEAKRLGGGTSSGMNRSGSVMNRQAVPPKPMAPTQNAAPAPAPAAQPAPARSPWMGMLGGLALGAGLGALLGHFGMGGLGGGGFGGMLLLLLVGFGFFWLVRNFVRRNPPAQSQPLQYAGAGYGAAATPSAEPAAAGSSAAVSGSVPAGFDVEGFVRQAKLNFVRLQAAIDAGNMEDIRAFTTPEMYAEIQLEFQERNRAAQQTDVVQLNAELLDLSQEAAREVASVRFSGSIRETVNAAPEAFDEVWHLVRPRDGSQGWLIAGIQQYA